MEEVKALIVIHSLINKVPTKIFGAKASFSKLNLLLFVSALRLLFHSFDFHSSFPLRLYQKMKFYMAFLLATSLSFTSPNLHVKVDILDTRKLVFCFQFCLILCLMMLKIHRTSGYFLDSRLYVYSLHECKIYWEKYSGK